MRLISLLLPLCPLLPCEQQGAGNSDLTSTWEQVGVYVDPGNSSGSFQPAK